MCGFVDKCPGPIPPGAKQTNCWRVILLIIIITYIYQIILYLSFGLYINAIINLLYCFFEIWLFQFIAYTQIEIREQYIWIHMGPQQCSPLNWICSNRLLKSEIILIETRQRQCCYDICPRCYCSPVNWSFCHKSYAGYFWPCCCDGSCQCCDLCKGDSLSDEILQFNLTQDPWECSSMCCKHCAPCPYQYAWIWCCVYNRIGVSIDYNFKNDLLNQLQDCGYPLLLSSGAAAVVQGTSTDTNTIEGGASNGTANTTNVVATTAAVTTRTAGGAQAAQGQQVQYVIVQPTQAQGQMMMQMQNGQMVPVQMVPVQQQYQQQYQAQYQQANGATPYNAMVSAPPQDVDSPPAYAPGSGGEGDTPATYA